MEVEQKNIRLSQAVRVVNILKNSLLHLTINQGSQPSEIKEIIEWIDQGFALVLENVTCRFQELFLREKELIKRRERRIGELERKIIKFTSKRSRGWVDVGGTRMCLFDIPGGWIRMGDILNLLAGEETYHRVMFEMGLAESFTQRATEGGVLKHSAKGMYEAVDTFSEAGFGDFIVEELKFSTGYARITCKDSFEGWVFRNQRKANNDSVCYYSAGVLLSFMQHITERADLTCTETKCIAKGDRECEFIIGTKADLEKRGIPLKKWGMTIKERAEYLENLLEEKQRVERELTRKYTELTVLNNIAARVNQSLDLKEILSFAINELQKIVGEEKAICIYLLDPQKNELVFTAQKGYSEEFLRRLSRLKIDESMLGEAVKARSPIAYDDYPSYAQAIKAVVEEAQIKSAMSVPLIAKNRIVGALSIASKTPYHFTEEEINLLNLIGNHIGVAVANAQLVEEVKESEKKYRTLVEDINDGYVMGQNGKIVFANQAFLRMYGYTEEEVLGHSVQEFFPWDEKQGVDKFYSDPSLGKGMPIQIEFFRKYRNGTELPTELKINFVEYDGKPTMIGIFRDISERKKMEQRVRESERLASIGQLAATIAHEIRNPLSAIKMNIQILSRNLKLQDLDERRFEIAAGEIIRLERIVKEVLDFARPLKLNKAWHNISEILKKCLELLQESIQEKRIKVVKRLSPNFKHIFIDGEMIEQAFLNIILNALDAMPNGGILEIKSRKLSEFGANKLGIIEFKDSGIGMNSE
ncbi:MAG: PAS domain S-box protein, partial [Desulfobacterota bacterium]|nr:PAS domain S-box protein [Thermodesulfobacteriota bacterium]